ncbi:MAG TPA: type II toxin-antitoxin system RelE/ParE family toxin [Longimicrobiales bacterium]|nr:type II toxin-antitoxin system RelE/ParE family toxin [Longimicrobiales bacterium]
MKATQVVVTALADDDIRRAAEFYVAEGSISLAMDFLSAVERTLGQMKAHPAAGSPRYAHELDLPGLRHRRVPGYPYLIFYGDEGPTVSVWRVLHEEQDIPVHLRAPG